MKIVARIQCTDDDGQPATILQLHPNPLQFTDNTGCLNYAVTRDPGTLYVTLTGDEVTRNESTNSYRVATTGATYFPIPLSRDSC